MSPLVRLALVYHERKDYTQYSAILIDLHTDEKILDT